MDTSSIGLTQKHDRAVGYRKIVIFDITIFFYNHSSLDATQMNCDFKMQRFVIERNNNLFGIMFILDKIYRFSIITNNIFLIFQQTKIKVQLCGSIRIVSYLAGQLNIKMKQFFYSTLDYFDFFASIHWTDIGADI